MSFEIRVTPEMRARAREVIKAINEGRIEPKVPEIQTMVPEDAGALMTSFGKVIRRRRVK